MTAAKDARDGALFVAAGLIAGLGHYAFQVLASRHLSASEFAGLSGWLAHVSLAFVLAGLVQYAANFHPLAARHVRPALLLLNILALVGAAIWVMSDEPLGFATAAATVLLAVLYGWATGQVQIRLDYRGLAAAQIVNVAVKLAIPLVWASGLYAFGLGLGLCVVPAVWVLSWRITARPAAPTVRPGQWAAPVLIAGAASVIPQFDLVLMQHTQDAGDFDAFARASLFYKGIYFGVFIFAQWLLPRQIRGGGPRWLGPGLVAGFAGLASVALAAAAPLIAEHIFHWSESPARGLVLLSCLHMSLLTILFVQIQAASAAGRLSPAIAILGALVAEAGLQLTVAWPATTYLAAAVGAQVFLVALALRVPTRPPAC